MGYLVAHFKAGREYAEHFELMLKTKLGFEPVMSWHPMSGERPQMFDKETEARQYYKNNFLDIYQNIGKSSKRIVFKQADDEYVAHFEIYERNLFKYKPVMSWHPISGEKPQMFDSWIQAKEFLAENNTGKKLRI